MALSVSDGIRVVPEFLGGFYITHCMWASKTGMNDNITVIKKFYKYLEQEWGLSTNAYEVMLHEIKEGKDQWHDRLWRYDHLDEEDSDDWSNEPMLLDEETYDEAELKELYKAIHDFCVMKPWKQLSNFDIFAIDFVEYDETYYGIVLGGGGENFGLSLLEGKSGLKTLINILNDNYELGYEGMRLMDGYTLLLDPRTTLSPEDRSLIDQSGIVFDQARSPMLRTHECGMLSYLPETYEISDMTEIFEAVNETLRHMIGIGDLDQHYNNKEIYVRRIFDNGEIEEGFESGLDHYNKVEGQGINVLYSQLDLKRLGKSLTRSKEIWEIDAFHMAEPVDNGSGQIYYPLVVAIMDHHSGELLNHIIETPLFLIDIQDYFIEFLKEYGIIPESIMVRESVYTRHLIPVFDWLDITIAVVDKYEAMAEFKEAIVSFESGNKE